jgi:Domain of Unknown Function (DUF928)
MTVRTKAWLMSAAFTIGTVAVSGLIEKTVVKAAFSPDTTIATNTTEKLIFMPDGGWKKPPLIVSRSGLRRTRSAGTKRGNGCGLDIVALVPIHNGNYLGVTLTNNPDLWFYLPPSDLAVKSLKLRLVDTTKNKKEIWSMETVPNPKVLESGLLKIPYKGNPLVNGVYFWEFYYQQVGCNDPQILSGYVQKETNANLALPPQSSARLRTYAQNGIWYELLTELITLKQKEPIDKQLAADFRSLIFDSPDIKFPLPGSPNKDDLDLMEKIVNSSVIDCCKNTTIKQ